MVNTRPPIITPADIEALKNQTNPHTGKPFTQADIARILGITDQYVSLVKYQTDRFSRTPREVARDSFPWKRVGKPYNQSALSKRLGDHAEYRVTLGEGMPVDRLRRLRNFYTRLRPGADPAVHLVVEFDPEIPPHEGNKFGGYAYRPREESDGELIIRVNRLAEMTPTAYAVWEFPEELPQIE